MSIPGAFVAFFKALDGGRSGPDEAPVTPVPSPVQGPPPLLAVVESLSARLADVEAQVRTIRPFVDEEVERARRHVEGLRTTVRRLKEFVEGSGDEPDASQDVPGGDAPASGSTRVLPMHGGMESQVPDGETIRAAARRALGMS